MSRILRVLWRRAPRRRRFWRYVSPQRRGAGLLLLILLLTGVYAYWYLTNDHRVREQAEEFLRRMTHGPVQVGRAHFSLFGGVELQNVRLYVPADDSPDPFFSAGRVVLHHSPWALFLTGRLQPTEIDCSDPVITLERKMLDDRADGAYVYSVQKLYAMASVGEASPSGSQPMRLPVLNLRQCKLRYTELRYEPSSPRWLLLGSSLAPACPGLPAAPWGAVAAVSSGKQRRVLREETLDIFMTPREGNVCVINFEQPRQATGGAMGGSVQVNLQTGQYVIAGRAPIRDIDSALPEKYRQWRRLYNLDGPFGYRYDNLAGSATIELKGVSMRLPDSEGGVSLTDVHGRLELDLQEHGGITVRDITGKLDQCGGAKFTISGRYDGYDKDSPFELKLAVEAMTLPGEHDLTGQPAAMVARLHEVYRPSGPLNVQTVVRRTEGKVSVSGAAEPAGMRVTYKWLPYPIKDLRGRITFDDNGVRLENLQASGMDGAARVTITGRVGSLAGGHDYDVEIRSRDVPLDATLRDSLPSECADTWAALAPRGRASADVFLSRRPEQNQSVMLCFGLDGNASVMYRDFPYRVGALSGTVRFDNNNVTIDRVTGAAGAMRCEISGSLARLHTHDPFVDLHIAASNLPLDDALSAALPRQAREVYDSTRCSGDAASMQADIRQDSSPLNFDVRADVRGVSLKPRVFPYRMTDMQATVRVRPGAVTLDDMHALHGSTQLSGSGELRLGGELGLAFNVDAKHMALDNDLLAALPANVQRLWTNLSPGGQCDLTLALSRRQAADAQLDYYLELLAGDMRLKYAGFPYALEHVSGLVKASPDRVELVKLAASRGQMHATISGVIDAVEQGDRARLSIQASELPIDDELLGALAPELGVLRAAFRPGGKCALDLKELELTAAPQDAPTSGPASTSHPATSPRSAASRTANEPQSRPNRWVSWAIKGSVAIEDAVIDAGLGEKKVTGAVAGRAAYSVAGLGLDAQAKLQSLAVGNRQITDLSAKLIKLPSSPLLRIDEMSGRTYQGAMTGFAELRLVDPLEYGLSLALSGADLGELFTPGTDATTRSDVTGVLTGNLQMTGVAGKPAQTRAVGKIQIAKARFRKLPVLLGLVNVMFLSLPGDSPFQEGQLVYRMEGPKMFFDEIHFQGLTMGIVGSGSLDTRTDALKLVFLANPGGKLPGLGELTHDLLQGLLRQIVEIHVTGTLSKPQTRTVPLHSLDDMIRKMTAPGD